MSERDKRKDLPHEADERDEEQAKAQKELDEVPPPGSDPLHEGP